MQALSHPDTGIDGSPGLCIRKINSLLWNSTFLALEKCSITSETLTGVSTPLLWLPRCDNSRTGNTSSSLSAGRNGGTGTVPSFIEPVLCISYHSKRNSTNPLFLFRLYLETLSVIRMHPDAFLAFIFEIKKCHAPVPCQTLLFHPKR